MKKNALYAAAFAVAAASLLSGCQPDYRTADGMVWNTTYHVVYESDRDLGDSILSTLNDVGASLNVFDQSSLVSRVNRADSLPVDLHFSKVYETSVKVNRMTAGAFDPTLGPLITAWGFGRGHKATSDTLRIDSLMAFTGLAKTRIEDGMLIKDDARIQFNFSAVAKGYGCDCVADMFRRNGVDSFMVEIGGEIRCNGNRPGGGKWNISIDRPLLSDTVCHDSQCVISVTDAGIATSGNYRNYHRQGATHYGHTISAVSGRPVMSDVLSVTVVADDAMFADAMATAMMTMNSAQIKGLAKQASVAVMFVDSTMNAWYSPGFKVLISSIVSEP